MRSHDTIVRVHRFEVTTSLTLYRLAGYCKHVILYARPCSPSSAPLEVESIRRYAGPPTGRWENCHTHFGLERKHWLEKLELISPILIFFGMGDCLFYFLSWTVKNGGVVLVPKEGRHDHNVIWAQRALALRRLGISVLKANIGASLVARLRRSGFAGHGFLTGFLGVQLCVLSIGTECELTTSHTTMCPTTVARKGKIEHRHLIGASTPVLFPFERLVRGEYSL